MANYTHAKISFDQALGRTLEVNHISIEEAASGHVRRESVLPPDASSQARRAAAKKPEGLR